MTSGKPLDSVLVVEDSQLLFNVIGQRLGQNFQLKSALTGEDAVKALKENHGFSAILLDLVLPRMDGFEVLRKIRERGDRTPVIIITARPLSTIEKDAMALGVTSIFNKPLDFPRLLQELKQIIQGNKKSGSAELVLNQATGKPYPLKRVTKCCFICGYEKVQVFIPLHDGYAENWSHGPYPEYEKRGNYEQWDFLKTMVMVCPYCFFASDDAQDFADKPDSTYPYSEESKKILARNMTMRKRLVPESLDIDLRFDDPNRSKSEVIESLSLADKCCNGLILAGKPGAYAQAGIYSTLLGALTHPNGEQCFRDAFENFENQLKDKSTSRGVMVKTYYFTIVLNMLLGRTVLGREIMKKVEVLYADRRLEEVDEEERDWIMRINHVWKNGVDIGRGREFN